MSKLLYKSVYRFSKREVNLKITTFVPRYLSDIRGNSGSIELYSSIYQKVKHAVENFFLSHAVPNILKSSKSNSRG